MGGCGKFMVEFFEYDTPHIVHIKSVKLGLFSRFLQLCIIAYVIGYVIVYQKGYQLFSDINSSVTTKLKGVAFPNFTDDQFKVPFPEVYRKVWDQADYVVPPQENGAFFVTTNVIITPNQTQGICPEDPSVKSSYCDPGNNTCIADKPVINGNGIMTGKCVLGRDNKTMCEIRAWCPVETNVLPLGNDTALLEESNNFTVLIKNSIEFPLFHIRRRNVLNSSNSTYLQGCRYHPDTDPSCPIFELGTVVSEAGENYTALAVEGGVVAIVINWECNLDFNAEKYCNPTYTFSRLDDPEAKIARGWNFRYATYHSDRSRTLYKAYGIRFVVLVHGRGGKFNIVPLMLNVGSGLALLGITTLICDIIVLYMSSERAYYHEKKYTQVKAGNHGEAEECTIATPRNENGSPSSSSYRRLLPAS